VKVFSFQLGETGRPVNDFQRQAVPCHGGGRDRNMWEIKA